MAERIQHVYDPEDPVEDFTPLPFEDENVPDDDSVEPEGAPV
jgi:hypothetical protein